MTISTTTNHQVALQVQLVPLVGEQVDSQDDHSQAEDNQVDHSLVEQQVVGSLDIQVEAAFQVEVEPVLQDVLALEVEAEVQFQVDLPFHLPTKQLALRLSINR